MGASFVPITVFTVLWGVVGIVCPFFAPKGPNRGIIQVVLMLTAATCWLFWLCCYMAQMNPLIGPKLDTETLIWMSRTWIAFKKYGLSIETKGEPKGDVRFRLPNDTTFPRGFAPSGTVNFPGMQGTYAMFVSVLQRTVPGATQLLPKPST